MVYVVLLVNTGLTISLMYRGASLPDHTPTLPPLHQTALADIESRDVARTAALKQLADDVRALQTQSGDSGVSHGSAAGEGAWLVIGFPTLPRVHPTTKEEVDYVGPTVDALIRELGSSSGVWGGGRVVVAVMDNTEEGGAHPALERAQGRVAAAGLEDSFVWLANPGGADPALADPTPGARDPGSPNKPGWKVRKQTRDVAALIRAAAPLGSHFMFMEDDFELCPHGLSAVAYMTTKMEEYNGEYISIRASFGLAGIVMPSSDALVFAQYLLKHQARRPPDHLCSEWTGKETAEARDHVGDRVNGAFRWNILNHLGAVSTLRNSISVSYPRCYEFLGEPVLFEVEAFSPKACPEDDVWPCPVGGPTRPVVRFTP